MGYFFSSPFQSKAVIIQIWIRLSSCLSAPGLQAWQQEQKAVCTCYGRAWWRAIMSKLHILRNATLSMLKMDSLMEASTTCNSTVVSFKTFIALSFHMRIAKDLFQWYNFCMHNEGGVHVQQNYHPDVHIEGGPQWYSRNSCNVAA